MVYFCAVKTAEESKSNRTRKFIIEKSSALFNKKGLAGTSISDIIKTTGLTKGSIYGNFKDKEEVAMAVFEYNVQFMLGNLYERLERQQGAIDKLLEYPKYFRDEYERIFENGGCAILNTSVEADDTHQELKDQVTFTIKKWESHLIDIIEQGKKQSEIHSELNSYKYASLFIGTFEGGVMLSKVTGETKYLLYALDHLESLIINHLKINTTQI